MTDKRGEERRETREREKERGKGVKLSRNDDEIAAVIPRISSKKSSDAPRDVLDTISRTVDTDIVTDIGNKKERY